MDRPKLLRKDVSDPYAGFTHSIHHGVIKVSTAPRWSIRRNIVLRRFPQGPGSLRPAKEYGA